jgi:hypothetical protein
MQSQSTERIKQEHKSVSLVGTWSTHFKQGSRAKTDLVYRQMEMEYGSNIDKFRRTRAELVKLRTFEKKM